MRPRIALALFVLALAACSRDETSAPPGPRSTPVTVIEAMRETVLVTESVVGRLEAASMPTVAAETAGRVVEVRVDAGDSVSAGQVLLLLDASAQRLALASAEAAVGRLDALLANQRAHVRRLQDLATRQSVADSMLEDAKAQERALAAQLAEARAALDEARLQLERTRVTSPAAGAIQQRMVSKGDFVTPGRALFSLVAPGRMRAYLPFPEFLAGELRPGQTVLLHPAGRPEQTLESRVAELRPVVGDLSRAVEVIVDLDDPGGFRAGGSVNADLVLAEREGVMLPSLSVVRRPAGTVVYVVEDGVARQREVATGIQRGGRIEIRAGLEGGETVVADGAGFLTDGAPVEVRGAFRA
jgi:RND family efflux transporter MFP subunit